ncbi:TetR/AcrR family transcriptional regulator [Spirillospora sp. NPDC048823]|uniref:TetR/AcrR family transcriptional regulator n=1 Tax=unclassified Spirillospora TaxID=2642701 RepID=UPI0037230891
MSAIPNRDRRTERREATRREIVDAAWDVARETGLSHITLREIARRVGMRSPSLYSHFDSKNAIYDAMFAQAYSDLRKAFDALDLPAEPGRRSLLMVAELFFDFAAADLPRYQLMNQRTIPGFTPSEESFAISRDGLKEMAAVMRAAGVGGHDDLDLWTGILSGFVDQQLANDPGGTRWRRQLVRLMDMYCDEVGVPGPSLRSVQ